MTETENLANLVTIGITTKNRWQDLKITLTNISKAGLGALPLLILDDASEESIPFNITDVLPHIKLQRFPESKGLIVRRNQIAHLIQTKYYLSLDDDSYPVSGSLEAAIRFAESLDNLFCLSFPIYNPVLAQYQNQSFDDQPYPVRCFVGCGHLLHKERFLQLGGYREELIHQGEEMEIAARAFQKNWYCYHFPHFLIHHTASNTGRNWHRMDFYGARNNVLWNDWFVPPQLKLIRQSRTLASRVVLGIKVRRWGQFQGEYAGFSDIQKFKSYRHNMSMQHYRQWQTLPYT
ncbi:glycosyltransferase family 2 protein [Nostoc sp. MS1]|uniref:glycosyltransferase family 2 protein n=1 Tax=Nostoc sp. MS1 TaxID=2764711 RepID=UPI001CC41CC0|nr:glycosyltransferase family A protein [Nostoc sp. MS1]BCL35193.1 hypothetical protein NSMS1_16400 [Nostoc sp. MS1]